MRVGHVELPVVDPGRSRRFYVDVLGFELVVDHPDIVWVLLGDLEIQLRRGTPQAVSRDLDAVNLVLYSNDVVADLSRLEARGVVMTARANCYHFRDPDGYWWQLVDPDADHTGA